MKKILLFVLSIGLFALQAQDVPTAKPGVHGKISSVKYVPSIASQIANGTFIPFENLPQAKEVNLKMKGANKVVPGKGFPKGDDPLVAAQRAQSRSQGRDPDLVFDADQNSNVTPTDPTGAVGPNHYIAAWNVGFRIFDKEGNPLIPEASLGTVLTGNTTGDPIILYDHEADRFVITEFDGNPNGFEMAVCEGPDPVNDGWYVYLNQFTTGSFPDYTKFSIWHDAYYVTANIGNNNRVFAVERQEMLQGNDAQFVAFPLPGIQTSGFYSPHGFNWTRGDAPAGDHTICYLQDDAWGGVTEDHLKLWNIRLDWGDVANSVIMGPVEITTTPFTSVFDGGSFSNLEQPSGPDVDALQATIMNQAQWRKFNGYNSALLNFVVDTEGGAGELAGIRWYELRQDDEDSPWEIYQEGTYVSPVEGKHACQASMAMDDFGNIGMAYGSVSSTQSIHINYTGRFNGDPLGMMTVDETLIAQGSSNNPSLRWADYSHLSLDPADGQSFWHIHEYFDPGRDDVVGVFSLAPALSNDMGPLSIDAPVDGSLSATEDVVITIRNYGVETQSNVPVSYQIDNGPWVNETYPGTLMSQENDQYTFTVQGDFSTIGQVYTINAAVALGTDENPLNDTISIQVTHLLPDDIGVTSINAPQSADNLGATEDVIIDIQNFGGLPQSNFDVSYTLDGGTPVTETVAGPLNPNSQMMYTFGSTVDMSTLGEYEIKTYTSLGGDLDANNDTTEATIEKFLCAPEIDCSFGDGFQYVEVGGMTNSSGCEDSGYSDFTNLVATLNEGTAHDLTVTTGWGSQYVKVWIDFNDDFTFTADEIVAESDPIAAGQGAGEYTETFDLTVPLGVPLGDHLMRMKANFNAEVPNDPCEATQFGETEDYTATLLPVGLNDHPFGENDIVVIESDNDQFLIQLESTVINDPLLISIIALNGQTVAENWIVPQNGLYQYDLDMSYAASGVYMARIWNKESSKIAKFLVK
ncbi:MAG: GEVED domain-containing protein [Bacteroidota bacterium]